MLNKQKFYRTFKQTPELDFLLDKLGNMNRLSWIAYALATVKWETNDTFKPVIEGYWIKKNRLDTLYRYYLKHNQSALRTIFPFGTETNKTYEGRGYVQLTHDFNYRKFGLYLTPEKAAEPETAYMVLEKGMTEGLFTGKKLSDYLNDTKIDFYNARKIINGLDKANTIAQQALKYFNALEWIERAKAEKELFELKQ